MADDPLLESTQLRRRLDTEFVCEHSASRAVPVERLGVTSGAVERDHQLGPAALAERLPCDQRLALADHLEVPAACQFGVDDVFFDGLSERLPAPHVTVGKAFPRYVGHRRAAPQRERRPQHRGGRFGVPARQLGATARNELFEVVHVEFARCHRQRIGPAPTDDGEPDGQQLARLSKHARAAHARRSAGAWSPHTASIKVSCSIHSPARMASAANRARGRWPSSRRTRVPSSRSTGPSSLTITAPAGPPPTVAA